MHSGALVMDQRNGFFLKLCRILLVGSFLAHNDTLIVDGNCLLLKVSQTRELPPRLLSEPRREPLSSPGSH